MNFDNNLAQSQTSPSQTFSDDDQSLTKADDTISNDNLSDKNSSPAIKKDIDTEEHKQEDKGSQINRVSSKNYLLYLGPIFLLFSVITSYFLLSNNSATSTLSQYPVDGSAVMVNPSDDKYKIVMEAPSGTKFQFPDGVFTKEDLMSNWSETMDNSPTNPTSVQATCKDNGQPIQSGAPTSCKNPSFVLSGATTKEQGVNIVGYHVYIGTENNVTPFGDSGYLQAIDPVVQGIFHNGNVIEPTESDDLVSGTKYYLIATTRTDSNNDAWAYGLEVVDKANYKTRSGSLLFEYFYQE